MFAKMSNEAYDQHGLMGQLMGYPGPGEAEETLEDVLRRNAASMTPALGEIKEQARQTRDAVAQL